MSKTSITHLPRHIAIVMDGNGRWANQKRLPRLAGHKAGVEAARTITKACAKKNIQVLSLFAFSSENWRRPAQEVSFLMELFLSGLEAEVMMLHKNNICLRFIGNRSRFNEKLCQKITEVEDLTRHNKGMRLIVAADYGGQWDIVEATRQLAKMVEVGDLKSDDITADLLRTKLSFADLPDPDLFIRTSGELRLSNFILWQAAYAELYFTPINWPDFNEAELDKALEDYALRERRFGELVVS